VKPEGAPARPGDIPARLGLGAGLAGRAGPAGEGAHDPRQLGPVLANPKADRILTRRGRYFIKESKQRVRHPRSATREAGGGVGRVQLKALTCVAMVLRSPPAPVKLETRRQPRRRARAP